MDGRKHVGAEPDYGCNNVRRGAADDCVDGLRADQLRIEHAEVTRLGREAPGVRRDNACRDRWVKLAVDWERETQDILVRRVRAEAFAQACDVREVDVF